MPNNAQCVSQEPDSFIQRYPGGAVLPMTEGQNEPPTQEALFWKMGLGAGGKSSQKESMA